MSHPLLPENKIFVGTHHKTGTVWMQSIFRQLGDRLGLKFLEGVEADFSDSHNIFFQEHSIFSSSLLKTINFRGLHLIRDPRDVIVSGMFYHQKSGETWLHDKRREFGGLTYQQKISSYESISDKILFEMENAGRETIEEMVAWDYTNPDFREVKYEQLIADTDLMLFHEIFMFLGFRGSSLPVCLQVAWNKSLFSNRHKQNLHRRSGKTNQWRDHFKAVHFERFDALFNGVLANLGYEHHISVNSS